jgi:hypothetical protein
MLNDADGHGGGEASDAVKDSDARRGRLWADVHPLRSTGRGSASTRTVPKPAKRPGWRLMAERLDSEEPFLALVVHDGNSQNCGLIPANILSIGQPTIAPRNSVRPDT